MTCQNVTGAWHPTGIAFPCHSWRSPHSEKQASAWGFVGLLRLARIVAKKTGPKPREAHPGVIAKSGDRVLVFQLNARPGGIAVQRSERHAGGGNVTQSVRFTDEAAFTRWCESDALRFAYPLLFSKLTRSGCELFNAAL